VYATFEMGGVSATNFDAAVLLGNISSAQSYEIYLGNSAVINAIVAAERDSVFAVETAINLARAMELGLTKRHRRATPRTHHATSNINIVMQC
jgi:hypothetical protein